jgi:hypothetical protein
MHGWPGKPVLARVVGERLQKVGSAYYRSAGA